MTSDKGYQLQPTTIVRSSTATYEIVSCIGRGGFGLTYLARMSTADGSVSYVALKEFFMDSDCWRDEHTHQMSFSDPVRGRVEGALKDFRQEAVRIRSFGRNHPNIVSVIEVFDCNSTAYYSMEYLQGRSLKEEAAQGMGLQQMMAFMRPVFSAVGELHRNRVTHLDIKPSNIMIVGDGNGGRRPVLIDFGLSKHYDGADRPTSTVNTNGVSEGFSPVEQYGGITRFSPRSDIYALAATAVYCLTGYVPPRAMDMTPKILAEMLYGSPSGTNPQVVGVLTKAMDYVAANRYETVEDFDAALCRAVNQPTIAADRTATAGSGDTQRVDNKDSAKIVGKKRSSKILLWVVLGVMFIAIAALCAYIGGYGSESDEKAADTMAAIVEFPIEASFTPSMLERQIGKSGWTDLKARELEEGSTIYDVDGEFLETAEFPYWQVSLEVAVRPDGQIVGRYYNPGTIDLDVNGTVSPDSETIYLRLGHGSQQSEWRLHRVEPRTELVYEGTWGRKNKPTRLTFRKKNE